MGNRDYYKPGDYNVICDRTGAKRKASECQMEWNGLFVSKHSWEARHPQDFVKGRPDHQAVPTARPRPTEPTYLGTTEVSADDL